MEPISVIATPPEESLLEPVRAPGKAFWNPALITIGIGILLAVVSFGVVTSQWGNPNTPTAGFFGILLGILIFVAGCLWLLVKIVRVVSRPR